jgi:hypothetical protein
MLLRVINLICTVCIWVARFFLTHYTQTKENQITTTLPNGHKMDQMTIKYASIFHSKALIVKTNHLAPLVCVFI